MARNQNGFTLIEGLLILVIVGILGGAGWYVYSSNNKANDALNNADKSNNISTSYPTEKDEKNSQRTVLSSFSVTPSAALKDKGSCKSGEVLFNPIYNSENFDYDCNGLLDAIGYASIIFGQSDSSILKLFSSTNLKEENIKISSGLNAIKYTFEDEKKGHGTSEKYIARYTLYQIESDNKFFYGIYWTGVGFSDEDSSLKEFNNLILNNWQIK